MSPADLKAVQTLKLLAPGDKLEKGRTYYAKILLTGMEAMFGSASAIAEKVTAAGFVGVLVSAQPIDDVPDRAPYPSGSTYWARGVWGGDDKQLGGGAVPSQIRAIWESEAPHLDPAKIKSTAPTVQPGASTGPTLKQLMIFGAGVYLLRKGRGRRLLGRLGLRL
jgi:hypothetical protein